MDLGIIELLIEILKISEDASILKACLTALFSILAEGVTLTGNVGLHDNPYFVKLAQCGGMYVIERLQESSNEEVAHAAEKIIKKYASFFNNQ